MISPPTRPRGDLLWEDRVSGKFHEKSIDELAAEITVLTRTADGWRIRVVHWSSQSRKK